MSLSGDAGWLALRALVAAPGRSLALSAALGIAFGMPALTLSAAARAQQALQHRARETPVVIGAPGDTFDLAFAAMHFRPGGTRPLPWATLEQLAAPGVLLAPMHVVHTADGAPVVGTAPEYFEARSLVAERGRLPAVVGEAVAGASAARVRGLQVGHTLRSDLEALHDLSGEAPLTLTITGILEHTGTSDDNALFTDV
ncbi:MAG: ABC transporter permease, partial [Myxococcota bacterium]|nr:ABC transporter permease [Myxococcota bacterium]